MDRCLCLRASHRSTFAAATLRILAQHFADHGRVVIEVPFDPHLRPGGVIGVTNEMSPKTRRRFYEIAAAIAEHFSSTAPGPREQRFR